MQNNKVRQNSQTTTHQVTRLIPPPQESVDAVFYQLYNLGLHENQPIHLTREVVSIIVSASNSLLHLSLNQRRELLMSLLPITEETGESDKVYEVVDTYPRELVPGDKVKFYQTAFVNGKFVSPTHLDPYDTDKASCDTCGAETHCWKEVRDGGGKLSKMCNHCLYSSDDPALRQMGKGLKGCETCTVQRCPRHPLGLRY
jgi:hypothetical protein